METKEILIQYIKDQITANEMEVERVMIVRRVANRLKDEERLKTLDADLVKIETALDELGKILEEYQNK